MTIRRAIPRPFGSVGLACAILFGLALKGSVSVQNLLDTLQYGSEPQTDMRSQAICAYAPQVRSDSPRIGSMTPGQRRAAIDAFWENGPSTAEKLKIWLAELEGRTTRHNRSRRRIGRTEKA